MSHIQDLPNEAGEERVSSVSNNSTTQSIANNHSSTTGATTPTGGGSGSSSPNVWKRHLLLLQENAPKPKSVICMSTITNNRPPFYSLEYHGPISRETADKMLSEAGEGAYLVRESQRELGTYTLCIRFDNVTKNYKLFYDGHHYVGEKRFDTLDDLVADGLISMYVEKHAADYIRRMAEETVYEESPYSQYQRMQQRRIIREQQRKHRHMQQQKQQQQHGPDVVPPDVIGSSELLNRHRNHSQGSHRSLIDYGGPPEHKAHRFKTHTFKGPHWCDYCRNYMWGLVQQGLKCEDCGFAAHRKCAEKVLQDCRPELKYVRRMFAVDLTTLTMAHNVDVPPVVVQCVAEIESRGLDVEGLYRVSGSHEDVEKLRSLFDTEGYADLSRAKVEDVHTVASLLKLYFRLLPQPLITYSVCKSLSIVYRTTISATRSAEHDKSKAVRRALQELPPAHYRTLRLLALHLSAVGQYSAKNRMTLENLSRIFVLTLMCPYSGLANDPLAMPQEEQNILFYILTNAKRLFAVVEKLPNETVQGNSEEIDAKAEEEFNIEKGRLVQQQRTKIMEYYEKKEKQVELQRKIQSSNMLNQARLRILKAQEDHVKNVLDEARARLVHISNDHSRYPGILEGLIGQALSQLLEPLVLVRCRHKDVPLVERAYPASVAELKRLTGVETKVIIDQENYLPPDIAGGVEVMTKDGKIRVVSTLESRLELLNSQMVPEIRNNLFGRNMNRKFLD